MRFAKTMFGSLLVFVVIVWFQKALVGATGDCSSGLSKTTVNGAECGGHAGTGQPCESTGICGSPAPAWMTSQPGCGSGKRHMWDTAPVMSTCENIGSGKCTYCGGGTTPSSGMECAQGHLYSDTGCCCDPGDPPDGNEVCSVVKYCGSACCEL